ncbi:MotA/TolQ/ExbB proton channel family protein [Gammaproteobacteria bacterium]|jgi:biopolymer transport protein ExbB|nr:MotA/TolQ/ExbB proton channel family protein [Gammaproteobacteria bacterium]MDC1491406.1 MotA/TolQ/ExbB proton channel family protein [Gammaproteobacteria bacterium]|tara:strand:- start:397 stop:1752 length:1356 start_codon:yes stop_codon:yes gene_type:complete
MKNLTKALILPLFLFSTLEVKSQEVSIADPVVVTDIEQLLELVKDSATLRSSEDRKRLADFNKSKQKQAKLLADARWLLKKESNREKSLTKQFEDNDSQLSDLEEQLNLKIGTLGELFGVVRQLSGDAKSTYSQSLTNLEFPSRIDFLGNLAERKALPQVPELEQLWYELLNEMNASGKISKFRSEVLDTSGNASMQDIIRIGQFNAIADSNYLRFIPEEQSLEFLSKNPDGTRSSLKKMTNFENGDYVEFLIDPSRGSLLNLFLQNPSVLERINQGGIVAYIILIILFSGLGLGFFRFAFLFNSQKSLMEELESGSYKDGSPLKDINDVMSQKDKLNQDQLETKIEAILSSTGPMYEKSISTIKLLAAVAPLLGLLGTVIGMIGTFQAITLFGTGDPKLMAGGISQALVTTMLGLIAAVPLLFMHNQLDTRSREIIQIIEEEAIGKIASK